MYGHKDTGLKDDTRTYLPAYIRTARESRRLLDGGAKLMTKTLRPSAQNYMGGCQNYGPFLGPHYNTAPII